MFQSRTGTWESAHAENPHLEALGEGACDWPVPESIIELQVVLMDQLCFEVIVESLGQAGKVLISLSAFG